jgi:hypothetical protein
VHPGKTAPISKNRYSSLGMVIMGKKTNKKCSEWQGGRILLLSFSIKYAPRSK